MRNKLRIIAVLALALIAGLSAFRFTRNAQARVDHTVRISGNIEVTDVETSFKTAGWVEARMVSEGETIEAGKIIARLDRQELEQELAMRRAEAEAAAARLAELEAGSRPEEIARAKASVERAQARLTELLAGSRRQEIDSARAVVQRAKAEKTRAETDYQRYEWLFQEDVISAQRRDNALAEYRTADATLAEAQDRLDLMKEGPRQEEIAQARAALAEAQAWYDEVKEGPRQETIQQVRAELARAEEAIRLAETRLSYTKIASPISGIILADHVESGEYVTPGAPIVTVGDLENVWLRGYINETDLGRVKLGQPVTVSADTYPEKAYRGVVSFISSEAEFTPKNVQTDKERVTLVYRVKIDIPNPDFELKPGMPADAEIHLDQGEG